jgi:uncharacterized membrane protein
VIHRTGIQAAASVAALLLWLAWWLGFASPPFSPLAAVGLAWLPLAPAIPALIRGSGNAAGWCSLAGVFYAGFAVMEAVANPAQRWRAGVALVLTLAMIVSQVRLIRARPAQPS